MGDLGSSANYSHMYDCFNKGDDGAKQQKSSASTSYRDNPGEPGIPGLNTYGDYYLESYGAWNHYWMIKDKIRTETYRIAIEANPHLFKGKTVIDVGCGTGILSLFAAKAGAKRVFAIESSKMADCAKQVMIDNKMDQIITVIKGRLEDIKELPDGVKEVDVIISEFMGYCLVYEAMTETVLHARDKWLKKDGILFPDICKLYIFGCSMSTLYNQKVKFWQNIRFPDDERKLIYDMSPMMANSRRRPVVTTIQPHNVRTEYKKVFTIDLNNVKIEDIQFMSGEVSLKVLEMPQDKDYPVSFDSIGAFFTVTFSKCHKPIVLSTSPYEPYTHWHQTVFFLENLVKMHKGSEAKVIFGFRHSKRYFRDFEFAIRVVMKRLIRDNIWYQHDDTSYFLSS